AVRRRNGVLDRMVEVGAIRADEAAAAKRVPLTVSSAPPSRIAGAFLLEAARREVEAAVGAERVRDAGLDVYTTMDPEMQDHVEHGVDTALAALERGHEWLRAKKQPLESSLVVVDLADGGVRALVGGRDFRRRPFDRAVQARRQA